MNNDNNTRKLYVPIAGAALLETPLLNKESAFTREERASFNLTGLLPPRFETIDEQVERAYRQFSNYRTPINKHVFLRAMQDKNETLFYRLLETHIEEMMPIIYTPTVGEACQRFSEIYRTARGLFVSWSEREHLDDILRNVTRDDIKIIVVTDGERILGLGDQGMGGMGIPIGKLSLYTACGGISPVYTLPVMIDVGTNNEELLNDPMYMGARHPRIDQEQYDEFIEMFISAVKRRWPFAMMQFEDFAQANATPLLERYRNRLCCFNDDIQGTAAVTVGCLLAASRASGVRLSEQRVVFVGGGSAGCGIAEQVVAHMRAEGLTDQQARSQVFMVDRFGLVTESTPDLRNFQQRLAQPEANIAGWTFSGQYPSLLDVVNCGKPGVLIGVSGQPGLFTEAVIRAMKVYCEVPIIFPLSNPSSRVEATPEQVIEWTEGTAVVATGSPFAPVTYGDRVFHIPQCNNSYIFPGIGLGVIAANINLISDEMMMAASETLAACSPRAQAGAGELLPPIKDIAALSKKIAFAVGKVAQQQGLALEMPDERLHERIDGNFWLPRYLEYRRSSY